MIDTDAFYQQSCQQGFVKLDANARNIAWRTPTKWGTLEITINLSKPEKDPRDISAAASAQQTGQAAYRDPATGALRSCPLCPTDNDLACGYARQVEVGGETWGLWYSPYAYFGEHCIATSWQHRPMHIDRAAFAGLFDIVDALPHYFFGSNADLPIVGGSILSHDHFQGGRHVFPMQTAPISQPVELTGFADVMAGVVRWPVSVLRLSGSSRERLVDAACAILDAWRTYDDQAAGIVSASDGARHNTITPSLCMRGDRYQLDLALRCNVTSAQHPLGVFHPHDSLHHIKKENIGLIEVMGLAILPPRVQEVMHARNLSQENVGGLFARVLECAGVFKWDDTGRAALQRFLATL